MKKMTKRILKYKVGDIVIIKSHEEILRLHPEYKEISDVRWVACCNHTLRITEVSSTSVWPYIWPYRTTGLTEENQPSWYEDEFYTLAEKLKLIG